MVVNVCTCVLEGAESSWEKFHIFLYTTGKNESKTLFLVFYSCGLMLVFDFKLLEFFILFAVGRAPTN